MIPPPIPLSRTLPTDSRYLTVTHPFMSVSPTTHPSRGQAPFLNTPPSPLTALSTSLVHRFAISFYPLLLLSPSQDSISSFQPPAQHLETPFPAKTHPPPTLHPPILPFSIPRRHPLSSIRDTPPSFPPYPHPTHPPLLIPAHHSHPPALSLNPQLLRLPPKA